MERCFIVRSGDLLTSYPPEYETLGLIQPKDANDALLNALGKPMLALGHAVTCL